MPLQSSRSKNDKKNCSSNLETAAIRKLSVLTKKAIPRSEVGEMTLKGGLRSIADFSVRVKKLNNIAPKTMVDMRLAKTTPYGVA